jgi:hypothetical protein
MLVVSQERLEEQQIWNVFVRVFFDVLLKRLEEHRRETMCYFAGAMYAT